MKVEPVTANGRPLLTAFGAGGFRFGLAGGDLRMDGAALVIADVPVSWTAQRASQITHALLSPVFEAREQIEFLLLGTGEHREPIAQPLRDTLRAQGIGLEIMDTPAACRAYNHLTSEGRHFAAALLPVGALIG